jgi:hypothetical protein
VAKRANTGLDHLWLPRGSCLAPDFVPKNLKTKTHRRAVSTVSMKTIFGIVPGTKYGWRKNVLYWKGIHRRILAHLRRYFAIAHGVIVVGGNGPPHGTHRRRGEIVLANDAIAAVSVCARLPELNPSLVWHLDRASHFLGNGSPRRQSVVPFDVLPEFAPRQIHPYSLASSRDSFMKLFWAAGTADSVLSIGAGTFFCFQRESYEAF